MPNLEEHCRSSLKRYGVEGRDIHAWLDEPSRHYTSHHREFRHDEDTIKLVGKIFGKKYGEDGEAKAQAIALDHIMADHAESIKKRSKKNGATISEIKAYKIEKPKYEKKKEELRKMLKHESELPEIKTGEMRDYLDVYLAHKKIGSRKLAEFSLRHWLQYVLSRENTNRDIEKRDITRFISNLSKKENETTISHYLGQLVPYFRYLNRKDLADYANIEKRRFAKKTAEAKKKRAPPRVRDVKRLYQNAVLEDKVLIRLLLLELDIPIKFLEKIFVTQDSKGEYTFTDGTHVISIKKETVKIAKSLIEKNLSKGDKRLLNIGSRSIEDRIKKIAEKINLSYKVTPMDLRKFGKNQNHDELMEWLQEWS